MHFLTLVLISSVKSDNIFVEELMPSDEILTNESFIQQILVLVYAYLMQCPQMTHKTHIVPIFFMKLPIKPIFYTIIEIHCLGHL